MNTTHAIAAAISALLIATPAAHAAVVNAEHYAAAQLESATPTATAKINHDMARKLQAVLKAADEDDLKLNPMNGLTRGDLRYAGEFGDLISDDYFARAEGNLKRQLASLAGIDRMQLNAKDRVAHDVFKYFAEFALKQHQEGILRIGRQWPIDHVFGQHLAFQQLSSGGGVAAYKTAEDYGNGLKRVEGFVVYLDRSIGRMKEGLREGRVQPRFITEKVIVQLDTELGNSIEQSPFYQPIKDLPANFSADEKKRLESAYRKAIVTQIRPVLKRLRDFMAADYLKAGRIDKPGLVAVPGGGKYYEYQLETHTTAKMPAEAIHKLGLAEVARILSEMDAIKKQVGFNGDRKAFFDYLQTDKRFQYASKDALLDAYRDVQKRVDAILPKYFLALPKSACQIKPIPPEQEGSAGGAYYLIGTPDGKRPGVFFVNTSNLPSRTSPRTTALYLHEGVPGHHLQGSLANEDESLPPMLRFNWNPGYGEGWALYAEWLGKEMGLYDDPFQTFGRLDMEIFRAVRLVVDTGLHAKGWSRQQAIDYMLANSTLDRAAVEQEIDRYIVWPGQATAYKVGELFIRDLRTRAENRLGKSFDVRRFHDAVLNTGALPLHVLGQKIEDWIENESRRGAVHGAVAGGARENSTLKTVRAVK